MSDIMTDFHRARRILGMSGCGRKCCVEWEPRGGKTVEASYTKCDIEHVTEALFVDFIKRIPLTASTTLSNDVMKRVKDVPCVGQYGMIARRTLLVGEYVMFAPSDYAITAVSEERSDEVERNAFTYPGDDGRVIDTVPGSNLQTINSAWNGERFSRPLNLHLRIHDDVVYAVVARRIRQGQELLLDYKF